MRRDDSSNVFLSLGPEEDDEFGALFDESSPRSGSGGTASTVQTKPPVPLRDPGPSIESELLRLCEEAGAPTEKSSPPPHPGDTVPAPPSQEEEEPMSSRSKLEREGMYDTIPAPPPSQKKDKEAPGSTILPPPTLPSNRIPKFVG